MELENTFTVPVPVDEAWAVLLDVARVAPCMPGATLDSVDGDEFTGRVKVKLGPIMLTYKGSARFVEKDDAAKRAVISAAGSETRGSGTASATVHATLTEVDGQPGQTHVRVVTDLAVTGKPAQFGRGVMADVAGKLVGQFAACLASEIGAAPAGGNIDLREAAPAETAGPGGPPGPVPVAPPGSPGAASAAASSTASAASAPAAVLGTESTADTRVEQARSAQQPKVAPVRQQHHAAEAINLIETAGMPVLKRVAPVLAVVVVALVLWRLLSR